MDDVFLSLVCMFGGVQSSKTQMDWHFLRKRKKKDELNNVLRLSDSSLCKSHAFVFSSAISMYSSLRIFLTIASGMEKIVAAL